MRLAYADPPYIGLARRYYQHHKDYAGEVDHVALVSQLQRFDGWALSASARSLPVVLDVARQLRIEDVQVAAWFRGARKVKSKKPLNAWEPVVFAGGRQLVELGARVDALICRSRPRTTEPNRVIGAKPAAFCAWMFDLLGARPGDEFVDVFPGSGGVSRAWELYASSSSTRDVSSPTASAESRAAVKHLRTRHC